ncbi:MAG: hypothetical protein AAFX06_33230 [Planctomycetota bacterium]
MSKINPDFRGADEIAVPKNLREMCGWSDKTDPDESTLLDIEQRSFGALIEETPQTFTERLARAAVGPMLEKWNQFQADRGRYPGSNDLSLLDEFVHGAPLIWLAQLIGSCVCSNTFRPWVARLMWQVMLLGDPFEFLGRSEFGAANYSFYGPFQYGLARQKANMTRGDGLYCAPFTWALMQGVLRCDQPQLRSLLKREGLAGKNDLPEPQGRDGMALYRDFGRHRHIGSLRQYIQYPMAESPQVTSAQQLWDLALAGKPAFVCSMEAIHKVGTHKDGFAIHARNPRDQWAHNMSFQGVFVASDGERFFRESNESWGEKHIYNRKFDEVDRAFRTGRLTVQAIGELEGPESSPTVAA